MKTIRVLIVDDHLIVREGLGALLRRLPDIEIVGEAGSGPEALALARAAQPDLVLMDLLMPGMDGLATTAALLAERPQLPILVLTTFAEYNLVMAAVTAGASGYLLKSARLDELGEAIRAVAAGRPYLHPEAQGHLVEATARRDASPARLTAREQEVLTLLGEGLSNRQIAERLTMTEKTASVHVSNILRKLALPSRSQAVLYTVRAAMRGKAQAQLVQARHSPI
jgi:two-component system, NarL family, response regulator LiaR